MRSRVISNSHANTAESIKTKEWTERGTDFFGVLFMAVKDNASVNSYSCHCNGPLRKKAIIEIIMVLVLHLRFTKFLP
jgi:hypothetical protein